MRIAIAQMNTYAGDFEETTWRLVDASRIAKSQGAELLVVGPATFCGNLPPDVSSNASYLLDMAYAFACLDAELACPLILPTVAYADDTYPDIMLVGAHGKDVRIDVAETDKEGDGPTSRGERRICAWGKRIAFAFVYDDLERLTDSNEDFDALFYLSCYGYGLDDAGSAMGVSLGESRFTEDANYLGCWFVGVASVGGYGTDVFSGASFVLNPMAELVAVAPAFEEALLVCDLDFDELWDKPPVLTPEPYNKYAHLWMCAVTGLRDYIAKRGLTDCCLVVDGSLATSVLAALAVDAVGPERVFALVADDLEFGDGAGVAAARELARSLHVNWEEAAVDPDDVAGDVACYRDLLALRLARHARLTGAVPISAADKTALALEVDETALEAASLLPLGDVYRTAVLELAVFRNTVSSVIPAHSFRAYAVPDIEGLEELALSPELCVKYCDEALLSHVEWERGLTDVCARLSDESVTTRILARFRDLEPARRGKPPVLRLSSRSLSDARMPLNNVWRPHVWTTKERFDFERSVNLAKFPESQRDGLERLDRMGVSPAELEEMFRGFANEMLTDEGQPSEAEERPADTEEKLDPADVERALSSVFGLLQDLAQSGTLMQPNIGAGEHHDMPGWDSPFSEN